MAAPVVIPVPISSGACVSGGLSMKSKQMTLTISSDSVCRVSGPQPSVSGRVFAPGLKSQVQHRSFSGKGFGFGFGGNLSGRGRVEAEAVAGSDIAPADSPSVQPKTDSAPARPAVDIVYEFYDGINKRDYERVADLFADECAYEDFNFAEPARGREEVMKFFKRIVPALGTEFFFVIDDITRDDPNAVGVLWHLDWRGKKIPNGRGCSFYRCEINSSGVRQIKYARDIVEPAAKPGFIAMGALRLIAALLKRFPQLGNGF